MPAIRTGKIHSPVQFILSAVPKMIEGTALAELRKKGQPEPEPVETIEEMESKLDLWYASAADSRKILETSTDPQVIDVQTQNLAGTQRRITEYETKLKEARGRGNGRNSANSAKSSKSHVQ
jgi:hypothetical protein